ncbi:hypothetical protein [Natronococcus occultus]|uniref:Uncharacterized protein n=1 Tax=Natronococcus occultus SP4 TaxID=694430 RepID=L0JZC2_9EURY|nr:hypothetical protein [Natronococcus occultus]AGB38377.1 hypothetical protein Natoc_2615 [Natronococcus occultus SP4]
MSSLVPVVYYGGFLVLFFFWIYGIVSFGLDVKNKIVPGIKQYRRGRKRQKAKQERDEEQDEREQQLY